MNFLNKLKKFQKLRFSAMFVVIGLIISIIAGIAATRPDGNYQKINATIASIEEFGTEDDITHTVVVDYEVNGKKYSSELGAYQSDWNEGDTVECEYNVENPAEVRTGDGKIMSFVICAVGIAAVAYGAVTLVKGIKTPADEFSQYDRVQESQIDTAKAEEIRNSNELMEEFVFHYTGKLNQSYVLEDKFGKPVYEAVCDGIKLVKETKYEFKNLLTGEKSEKMISHTVTDSYGSGVFGSVVKSAFEIDGENCWKVIASKGYGFRFYPKGIKAHYDVKHMGVEIGYAELAGTGSFIEKYKDNPLGKVPTNGIFKVECPRSEIEGMFLICFCITKTEATLN